MLARGWNGITISRDTIHIPGVCPPGHEGLSNRAHEASWIRLFRLEVRCDQSGGEMRCASRLLAGFFKPQAKRRPQNARHQARFREPGVFRAPCCGRRVRSQLEGQPCQPHVGIHWEYWGHPQAPLDITEVCLELLWRSPSPPPPCAWRLQGVGKGKARSGGFSCGCASGRCGRSRD